MNLFLPSCNFRKIDPVSYDRMNEIALKKGLSLAPCCREDTASYEHDATIFFMCQACRSVLEKRGIHADSIWRILAEDDHLVLPDLSSFSVTVIDCWRDREHKEIATYVRRLLERMHVTVKEAEKQYDFCGRFHMETKLYQDEVAACGGIRFMDELPKELYEKLLEEKVDSLKGSIPLVYCNTCYNSLRAGGANPIHLAQLITQTIKEI